MKWVTRRSIRVNRTATCWLIRRFIDAVSQGFPIVTKDDQETVEKAAFVYEALFAALQERQRQTAP